MSKTAPVKPRRQSVTSPSLREVALEEIQLAISTGRFNEDTVYSAAGLAKDLGMSLSPVREAMMSLVSAGTVEAVPNRGFRLVPISPDELDEIIRIRIILSLSAVDNICARTRAASGAVGALPTRVPRPDVDVLVELDRLGDLAERGAAVVATGAKAEFLRIDREFHRRLLECGLGVRGAEISLQLRDQSRLAGHGGPIFVVDRQTADDLVEIVDLLRTGDAGGAQVALARNLNSYRRAR